MAARVCRRSVSAHSGKVQIPSGARKVNGNAMQQVRCGERKVNGESRLRFNCKPQEAMCLIFVLATTMQAHFQTNPNPNTAINGMEAVTLNNQALQLSNRGDNAGAERLHKRALAMKESAHGPGSFHVAITLNALGEVQLRQNKLVEAEENLRRAVAIQNSTGNTFDAAVSRENFAQVLEAKGDLAKSKQMRDQGRPDKLVCGHYKCPGQMFDADHLKTCARCKCVYYCSAECQKADWSSRHKRYCKAPGS